MKVKNVLISYIKDNNSTLAKVKSVLKKYKIKHKDVLRDNLKFSDYKDMDLVIAIGGDGTFLDTISLVRNSNIPVVGINTGRLGFLANIPKEEIEFAIDEIIKGNFSLDKRALLRLETKDNLIRRTFVQV